MLNIDQNQNIYVTRGDTLPLTVQVNKDGEPYEPQAGDSIRFALSIGYVGMAGYKLILSKAIPTDTLTFELSEDETQALIYPQYNYDVEYTYADGTVDTFISAQLYVLGEVE
jgi:hypothetical protein